MHPARVAYSSAYLLWHARIAAGSASPMRPADGSDRPFPAPGHLLGADPAATAEYDRLWPLFRDLYESTVPVTHALAALQRADPAPA